MQVLLIVLAVVVVAAIVVAVAVTPMLNRKADEAVDRVKEILGADQVKVIEPKATGLATEPEEAGGLRGLGCLGASDTTIAFVTTAPHKEFTIDRSAVTEVTTAAADPGAVQKTTIEIHYTHDGEPAKAMWRIGRDLNQWLTELGYDWGPDGPPAEDDTADTAD